MATTESLMLAFGDPQDLQDLFAKINAQCKLDKQSLNKLAIIELDEQTDKWAPRFRIDFDTKYYELRLDLIVIDTAHLAADQIDVEALQSRFSSLEGFIIYSNEQNEQCLLGNDLKQLLKSLLNLNNNCFQTLIRNSATHLHAHELIEEFDDLIEFNLSEVDDEGHSDLNEFINCLFVHDWQEIKLKEPAKPAEAASKQPDDDNEEDEPDNFNFEDMLMNLGELKSKAASLSFEERKKYAEDIVLKFWETMGGDESEIAELD